MLIFFWVVGILFIIIILAYVLLLRHLSSYAIKMLVGLPWLKWMTLNEVIAKGFPPLRSKMILDLLHDDGYLEVRPKADLSEAALKTIEKDGFILWTVEFHEFRIIRHPPRRKKIRVPLKSIFGSLLPSPNPARA
jgi:hypothetical protein